VVHERRLDVEQVDDRRCNRDDRRSTAAVVQVVQPRFDAPLITNRFTLTPPPSGDAVKAATASMARTALLVIGAAPATARRRWRRYLSHV